MRSFLLLFDRRNNERRRDHGDKGKKYDRVHMTKATRRPVPGTETAQPAQGRAPLYSPAPRLHNIKPPRVNVPLPISSYEGAPNGR